MSRSLTAVTAAAGIILGAGAGAASFWALTGPISTGEQRFGPWATLDDIGQGRQNPYTRARVALYGIWGLPPSEVIYFTGDRDSAGAPLRPNCTYALRGGSLPTRWWSVTLYRDGYYIANSANRYSWSNADAQTGSDGRWTITLAPKGEGRNRLTFGPETGLFQVSLRLYQPSPGVADHRDRVTLPTIDKLGCGA